MRTALMVPIALAMILAGCGDDEGGGTPDPAPTPTPSPTATATPTPPVAAVNQRVVASFDNPWAMVFLPDGRMLVTEKPGRLQLVTQAGAMTPVANVPRVTYSGQLGFQDVVLDPGFASNNRIWISYAEPATGGQLGARLAFAPDGRTLFISSGERQQGTPAQDLSGTLGKIVRITLDGTAAAGNPFAGTANARPEIWSLGHRNPDGLVFASDGRLFESEMGPAGGDEFNLIEPGRNYGWPRVSEGDNYDGSPIPRHVSNAAYTAPLVSWTPVIAPGGMIQYRGTAFAGWTGDFLLAGLTQQGIVRVRVSSNTASEVARIGLGNRIREVEEGPNGSLWVLRDGDGGALVELTPR